MSQYANFYLKSKSGEYLPIDDFSRNTAVYECCEEYLPYENGIALTESVLDSIMNGIHRELDKHDDVLKQYKDELTLIATFNNSVEEKMEAVNDVENAINSVEEITAELKNALSFFSVLWNMVNNVGYYNDYNADEYVYAGIEWNPNWKGEE